MRKDFDENDRLRGLLAAVALGDRAAFRTLYDATSARLFGFALRVLPQEALAEEALQDAFVAVWHAASSYQAHLAAPLTWMATVVRNKALDIRRRAQAGAQAEGAVFDGASFDGAQFDADPLAALQDMGAGPQERMQLSREAAALARCMETLASRQRQSIGLAYLHELSHSEVAAQLGQPIGSVKTWIRRGLERLRDCMGKRELA